LDVYAYPWLLAVWPFCCLYAERLKVIAWGNYSRKSVKINENAGEKGNYF